MQAPTHLATGILIEKAMEKVEPACFRKSSVAFLAALSHAILDVLSDLTYHPPEPILVDSFWFSYHLVLSLLTICIFIRYWGKYRLGILCSILPDFDWLVVHLTRAFKLEVTFCKEPVLHRFLLGFVRRFTPFRLPKSLPNWRLNKKTVLMEFALWALLTAVYCTIGQASRTSLLVQERRENRERSWFS